ncbi:PD-(D/E)XK nuclease superfamily protein [Orenia metallireducens]|uniref:PD-(D/E)XK nuclease superfamily protein n=1 Tax=Orenia metallireducens TaxID=1413210 RepID=A0A285IJH7_9FIRM|nr:AAA family ATPase [Orenia metallireducens]PRX16917.1 PD-(D/E)XK nuclease superfamily protein [Orenia metallireducens]SNY47907.1 PD-(D/E)XK nuclease superfamily protein [Orenia metallireducens]
MKKLPIGISDFKELIENGHYFVDKSLFIKDIIDEDAKVILLPRPRRFGKTLNISMLKYFFEKSNKNNSYLFDSLKIKELGRSYLDRQGKSPVIFLTFKGVKNTIWEDCLENIKDIISMEYERHAYLLEGNLLSNKERIIYQNIVNLSATKVHYQKALSKLTLYLERYHGDKAIVLIDEYDQPIQSGYMNGYYEEIINFMRGFLESGLKDNTSLEKGVLTGILRVAKESIFSGLNNLLVSTLLDTKYDNYFGLLETEVEEIFNDYNLNYKLEEIKEWYNGYYFGDKTLYNPWSIINCIYYQGELKPYWINTSGNEIIKDLIINGDSEIKSDIELLIKDQSIEKKIDENIVFGDIDKKSSSLWSFLLLSGYLRASDSERRGARLYCNLEIPNQEVKYIYEEIVLDWFEENITSQKLKLMLEALTNGDIEVFSSVFREFVLNSMSSFDIGGNEPEKVYHAFVLGLLLNLRDSYQVKSNRESGYGRYDVMIIPDKKDKLGIIMEFKKVNEYKKESLEEAVEDALKQIKEKRYKQELLAQGIDNVLEIGIAFSGKEVAVKSEDKG